METPLALDHIVIAVHNLEAAIADYRAMGFQVLVGGQHPGRTSHNALIVFADGAYLEIIAWRAPAPEERWYRRGAEEVGLRQCIAQDPDGYLARLQQPIGTRVLGSASIQARTGS